MALSDYNYGPWWSPAGERRGEYLGVSNLAYSPNKTERDQLYKKGVNPIVQFAGRGILLFGDKTKLARPSAFDRINVRRLFLAIEKSVSEAARNFMFEFNDEFTRAEFTAIVEPLLREIQSRRGIQDYYVQCDELNNTPEVIDRNELVATMFIKPSRSINYITLNFVATRSGLDFDEVVGRISF
jgi:phage tail sheath protein FI